MDGDQLMPRRPLPWHLSWLTIVLALLAIGTFFAVSNPNGESIIPMIGRGGMEYSGGGSGTMPSPTVGAPAQDTGVSNPSAKDMYYPYPNPDVPITDTREFLKVYYNASMRTRDVPVLTRRVETIVRGYDGRIDQQSSSRLYGFVSFALPQNKFEVFRTELESIVGSRFLTVNISSQNLLSQKVSIEEQQKQATDALATYKATRQKLVNTHALSVQTLQSKIDASPQDSAERAEFVKQLLSENSSYTRQLSNADANIKYAQDWQKAVQTQDQTLLNNVATVTGTISLQWISYWDMAQLYLPGYWIPAIFAALTFLSFLRDRRRSLLSITL